MDYPQLKSPPVVEAVMGVSIIENEYWQDYYKDIVDIIKNNYSVVNERIVFRSKSRTNTAINAELINPEVIKDGYTLSNPENKKTLLLKPDMIQLTKKAPYIEWDDLFVDFKEVLQALNRINPISIFSKPYLRYRNEFTFPVSSDDSMNNHFNIVHSIPNIMTQFPIHHMSFNIDLSDNEYLYKIEQKLSPASIRGSIAAIININVSDVSIKSNEVLDVINSISMLREKKNQLFFNLITDKVLNIFA